MKRGELYRFIGTPPPHKIEALNQALRIALDLPD
jgi:hypothetical protein